MVEKPTYEELEQKVRELTIEALEHKRAEEALQENEERFRTIYENSPVLIDSFDKDGRCILWNKKCEKTFGWTMEEINTYDNPLSLFYPDPDIQKQGMDSVTLKPEGVFREWHPMTKDGSELVTLWANFRLADGTVINIGYDITENRKAEEALHKAHDELEMRVEERTVELVKINEALSVEIDDRKKIEKQLQETQKELDIIFNSVPALIWSKNNEGKYLQVNRTYCETVGLPKEKILGRTDHDLYPADIADQYSKYDQEIIDSKKPVFGIEERHLKPSGDYGWSLTQKLPYYDAESDTVGTIGFAIDITSRRQAEEALQKAHDHLESRVADRTKELRIRTHELGERVRELNCFYGISLLLEKPHLSLEKTL